MIAALAVSCIAINMYFEATIGSVEDRIAVSMVVRNRANRNPKYNQNVCEVIAEPSKDPDRPWACQFSWTCDPRYDGFVRFVGDTAVDKETFMEMYLLAYDLHTGKIHYDPTLGADHYLVCGTKTKEGWELTKTLTVKIGDHCYYK